MAEKFLRLTTRLKGYSEPDTSSQMEGYLGIGEYEILDERYNYPNNDTDYVLIEAPSMDDQDTWVCIRWKSTQYATVIEKDVSPTPQVDFSGDFGVSEAKLLSLLPQFTDFTYVSSGARYPFALRGIRLKEAPPAVNNCCTFVEGLLVKAWQDEYPDLEWTPGLHRLMMINGSDKFGPITALVDANMAMPLPDIDSPPPRWTVIQGWTKNWDSGHTFIILDHHEPTGNVLTLESNRGYRLNGVGFRMIGNLRDTNNQVPNNWWQLNDLKTWRDIKKRYIHRQMAYLKVTDLS